jgi:hypothetical protein
MRRLIGRRQPFRQRRIRQRRVVEVAIGLVEDKVGKRLKENAIQPSIGGVPLCFRQLRQAVNQLLQQWNRFVVLPRRSIAARESAFLPNCP